MSVSTVLSQDFDWDNIKEEGSGGTPDWLAILDVI
jgi:hypothetical protein